MLAGATRHEMADRVDRVRGFSGLGAAFDEPVRGYSAGMVLRLAFASAVHADPDVLLVDEVLAVGDAFFQQRCLRRIRELQARGCTCVLVTHDPAAVISFCDQALWLEHGRAACAGDPAKVVREYMGARYRDEAALDESPLAPRSVERAEEVELAPARGIANVDHRYGDERATIEGIALRDERGGPLAAPAAGELLRVVITIRGHARIDAPIVGFTLRGHLGEIITATNTAYERRQLPPLGAGDRLSVEFALRWPPFASGTFSLSPAIADGTLDRHHMNDWIDNARVPSADHILPGFQGLKAGDVVPTGPRGDGFSVVSLEPNRSLVMEVHHTRFHVTFSTLLNPVNEEETRLVMRVRAAVRFNPLTALYYALLEPGDFVMMRKMMLGIKQRSEAMADERRAHTRVFEDVLLEAMKYG